MKILLRLIVLSAGLLILYTLQTETGVFRPLEARLHIPAPSFSLSLPFPSLFRPLPGPSFSFGLPAPRFSLDDVIHAAAQKYQVPHAFIKSIIAAESAFRPTVVSNKGAIGLMQLMPDTARAFGVDPFIPEQNVEAGTGYLAWLMRLYSNRQHQLRDTIAAYNAGPGAVARYNGVPPFRETRQYVVRVLRLFAKYQQEDTGVAPDIASELAPSQPVRTAYVVRQSPARAYPARSYQAGRSAARPYQLASVTQRSAGHWRPRRVARRVRYSAS